MHDLTTGWTFDPFLLITALIAAWHEYGLRHLAARSRPERNRVRRRHSLLFYSGLIVLDLAVMSPIDHFSDLYFYVHQIQHLLLLFAGPVLIVAGAPWLALAHGLPVGTRRKVGRALLVAPRTAPLRRLSHILSNPWLAIVLFNVNMVFWHIPVFFDLAYRNHFVHIWLMHGLMFGSGILFWRQFIGSYPFHPGLAPFPRIAALFGTNVVMFIVAVALGTMVKGSVYPVYDHLRVGLSAAGDQHLGAGILWVCGDLWCLPAIYRAVRSFIDEDETRHFEQTIERLLRGV